MPQHYTVPTKNPFAALDDSDNEDRILSKPDEVPEVTVPKAVTPKAVAARDEDKPRRTQRFQGIQRGAARKGLRSSPEFGERTTVPDEDGGAVVARKVPLEARRSGRRGSHHDRPTTSTNKREFDRHSGTGRGTEIKRSGHGSYNWGTELGDASGVTEESGGKTSKNLEAVAVDGEVSPVNDEKPTLEEVPDQGALSPVEDGPKTKSYAMYMAELEEKKKALLPQAREQLPEQDPIKLEKEGYQVYTKTTMGHKKELVESDSETDKRPKAVHLAEIAEQSGVQLHFGHARGGVRGGRGRGAERLQRGVPKPEAVPHASQTNAPRREINLADAAAFPTLEAH